MLMVLVHRLRTDAPEGDFQVAQGSRASIKGMALTARKRSQAHRLTTMLRATQGNTPVARGNERSARHPRGRATELNERQPAT
ncbi:hypothetical protein DK37_19440 [Halomonas sp. SUBG004]|nr:hypothetical protein DK37_19440 [Halomonas sp. SUBG004]